MKRIAVLSLLVTLMAVTICYADPCPNCNGTGRYCYMAWRTNKIGGPEPYTKCDVCLTCRGSGHIAGTHQRQQQHQQVHPQQDNSGANPNPPPTYQPPPVSAPRQETVLLAKCPKCGAVFRGDENYYQGRTDLLECPRCKAVFDTASNSWVQIAVPCARVKCTNCGAVFCEHESTIREERIYCLKCGIFFPIKDGRSAF